ncbi:hypothetical protein GOBAR_DD07905 [Gossypium barbadense]|nr:hypothetical protein GOBAR_DD07905 [Gossypium barbadense]
MEKNGDLINLDSYNIWLLGLLRNAKLVEAQLVLKDMVDKGVEPNIYSYNIVMDGLCKNGMLSDARMVMGFIVRSGLSPDTVTYARMFYHIFDPASFMPMVDDLGKRGNKHGADELAEKMLEMASDGRVENKISRKPKELIHRKETKYGGDDWQTIVHRYG